MEIEYNKDYYLSLVPWRYLSIHSIREDILNVFSKEEVNNEDIENIYRKYGKLFDNMTFMAGKGSVVHTIGLLDAAMKKIMNGFSVILIEGCDHEHVRRINDIDMMCSKDGLIIGYDYKAKHSEDYEDNSTQKAKDIMLKGVFDESYELGSPLESKIDFKYNFEFEDPGCVFDRAFDVIDGYLDQMQDVSREEFNQIRDRAIKSMNPELISLDYPKVQDNKIDDVYRNIDKILGCLRFNGVNSMREFEELRREFPLLINQSYCGNFFNQMRDFSTKPLTFVPLIKGFSDTNSPFDRAKELFDSGVNTVFMKFLSKKLTVDVVDQTYQECEDFDIFVNKKFSLNKIRKTKLNSSRKIDNSEIKVHAHKEGEIYTNSFRIEDFCLLDHIVQSKVDEHIGKVNHRLEEIDDLDYSATHYERLLEESKEFFCQYSNNRTNDDLEKIVDNIMLSVPDSGDRSVKASTKKHLMNQLYVMTKTKYSDLISIHQDLADAVINSGRITQKIISNSSIRKNEVNICFNNVSNRRAIAFNSSSFTLTNRNETQVCIQGDLESDMNNFIIRQHSKNQTRWFTVSPVMLDWWSTVYHKYLSFYSQHLETFLTHTERKHEHDGFMLALISLINSSGFSQASECVRYLFVGSTGISKGLHENFKNFKFRKENNEVEGFYVPKSHIEKIFFLRAMKTFPLICFLSAHDIKGKATSKFLVKSELLKGNKIKDITREWHICFPHESTPIYSENSCYNSLYVCRLLTMNRNNDLLEECLVAKKFIDSRKSFIRRTAHRQSFENITGDLLFELNDIDFVSEYKEFNPNLAFVALSAMNSIFRLGKGNTISQCLDMYNFSNHTYNLNINDVMNNRGSVRYQGEDGIVKLEKIKTETNVDLGKGKTRMEKKTEVKSQVSKCYKTTMENINNFQDDNDVYKEEFEPSKLLNTTTSLIPVLLYNSRKKFKHVGRMVKKGEIGPREIGVLNSPMRLSAFFVESLARHQRKIEHDLGDHTNMIEQTNKEEKVGETFDKTVRSERYYFDNADCSKWGPSQLSYVLYLVLGSRIKEPHMRKLLRFQLKTFSNKIIKYPIKAGLEKISDSGRKDMIGKVCYEMTHLDPEIGNAEMGYFHCPEGIIQGILGNTTSLLAADNLRMIETALLSITTNDRGPMFNKITSYDTSDDVCRAIEFSKEYRPHEVFDVDLSYTMKINSLNGIKRNLYKSSYSQHVCEFSSIFRTLNGIYNVDFKFRISSIDFSHSSDMVLSAEEITSKSLEYMRKEGSFLGSMWIGILNTHLHLKLFQGLNLFRNDPKLLYNVPFELMGIPELNTLSSLLTHPYFFKMKNYRLSNQTDSEYFSYMLSHEKRNANKVTVGDENTKILSLTRSGMMNIMRKPSRKNRDMTEFLDKLNDDSFVPVLLGLKTAMTYLLSNEQREMSEQTNIGSATRYIMNQPPVTSIVFKINSPNLRKMFKDDCVSKLDIVNVAKSYHEFDSSKLDLENYELLNNLMYVLAGGHDIVDQICHTDILEINAQPKKIQKYKYFKDWLDESTEENFISRTLENLIPKDFGGSEESKLSDFIRNRIILRSKISKICSIKKSLWLTHKTGDIAGEDNWVDKILKSNYTECAKAQLSSSVNTGAIRMGYNSWVSILSEMIVPNNENSIYTRPVELRELSNIIKRKRVKTVNITQLINFINANQMSLKRSELLNLNLKLINLLDMFKQYGISAMLKGDRYMPYGHSREFIPGSGKFCLTHELFEDSNGMIWKQDVISRNGDKYVHNIIHFDELSEDTYTDGKKDVYKVIRNFESPTSVTYKIERGFLLLVQENGFRIAILGEHKMLGMKKITLRKKELERWYLKREYSEVNNLLLGYQEIKKYHLDDPIIDQFGPEFDDNPEYTKFLTEETKVNELNDGIEISDDLLNLDMVMSGLNMNEMSFADEGSDEEYISDMDDITIETSHVEASVKSIASRVTVDCVWHRDQIEINMPIFLEDRYQNNNDSVVGQIIRHILERTEDGDFERFWSLSQLKVLIEKMKSK
jgi:hypothetical protein